jgi:DnaK suppressor protein
MTMRLFAEPTSMRGDPKIPEDYRPSEDEPFMSDRQRAYFRRKLLGWRDEILRATKDTLLHLHDESVQHPDITDRASTETQLAVELRARDRQRKLIAKIDAALERLDAWHLWLLRRNWRAGRLKRLDARPIATLSVRPKNAMSGANSFTAPTNTGRPFS